MYRLSLTFLLTIFAGVTYLFSHLLMASYELTKAPIQDAFMLKSATVFVGGYATLGFFQGERSIVNLWRSAAHIAMIFAVILAVVTFNYANNLYEFQLVSGLITGAYSNWAAILYSAFNFTLYMSAPFVLIVFSFIIFKSTKV